APGNREGRGKGLSKVIISGSNSCPAYLNFCIGNDGAHITVQPNAVVVALNSAVGDTHLPIRKEGNCRIWPCRRSARQAPNELTAIDRPVYLAAAFASGAAIPYSPSAIKSTVSDRKRRIALPFNGSIANKVHFRKCGVARYDSKREVLPL